MQGRMQLWKTHLESYKMSGILFTSLVSPPSFVEFLSISKAFLSADEEESSANLEPFKQIKIFTLSQTWLDSIQVNLNHITMLMGSSTFPFQQSNCQSLTQIRYLILTNVALKTESDQPIQFSICALARMFNFHFLLFINILTESGRSDSPFQEMLLLLHSYIRAGILFEKRNYVWLDQ